MCKTLSVSSSVVRLFLILVGVVIDTLQQIESHLMMRHYDGLLTSATPVAMLV